VTPPPLSERLRRVVEALPLRPGMRVLEIGGAPGAAAREVAVRVGPAGHVRVVDRSPAGIRRTQAACAAEIEAGLMSVQLAAVEDLVLPEGEAPYDLAFACRVGALDGRHPALEAPALRRIAAALVPAGRLLVDTGDPLRDVPLPR